MPDFDKIGRSICDRAQSISQRVDGDAAQPGLDLGSEVARLRAVVDQVRAPDGPVCGRWSLRRARPRSCYAERVARSAREAGSPQWTRHQQCRGGRRYRGAVVVDRGDSHAEPCRVPVVRGSSEVGTNAPRAVVPRSRKVTRRCLASPARGSVRRGARSAEPIRRGQDACRDPLSRRLARTRGVAGCDGDFCPRSPAVAQCLFGTASLRA